MDTNRLLEAVKTMPLGEVYAFAIEREQEAQKFYLDAKEVVADLGAKAMLNDLFNEEVQHEKMLAKAREVGEVEIVGAPRGFADLGLAEMMPEVDISGLSSPQDVLIRAMKKEAFAAEFYAAAAQTTDLPQAQKLFQHLSVEEKQHKGMLETWYDDHILTHN